MAISRRRFAAVLSGSLLVASIFVSGALQAGAVSAAGDPAPCINALIADRLESVRISREKTITFNMVSVTSALSRYRDASIKYTNISREDYFKAYQYAYRGNKTTANAWVKKGNDAILLANKAIKSYNLEVAKVNTRNTQHNADTLKLGDQMAATNAICAALG